jgi:hypothetical protein
MCGRRKLDAPVRQRASATSAVSVKRIRLRPPLSLRMSSRRPQNLVGINNLEAQSERSVPVGASVIRSASCHPDAPHYAKGQCRSCYRGRVVKRTTRYRPRRNKQMGLTGLGERLPERVAGVEHRAVLDIPPGCPKCRNSLLTVEGRRVACPGHLAGCGWDAYLVSRPLTVPLSADGALHA